MYTLQYIFIIVVKTAVVYLAFSLKKTVAAES